VLIILNLCDCILALLIRHAMRFRHIILSSVACSELPYFSTLCNKRRDKKKVIEHKMRVSILSTTCVTRYELGDPAIESRWEEIFLHPSTSDPGPNQPSLQGVPVHFRRIKRPGRGVDHPPPSSAEANERVELYLYSPLYLRGLF
jgi:hypothetical protein